MSIGFLVIVLMLIDDENWFRVFDILYHYNIHSEPGYNEVVRSNLFLRYIQVFVISRFPLYKEVLFNFIIVSLKQVTI